MATGKPPRGTLKGIAALRGLAALSIVPYHALVQLYGEGSYRPFDAAYSAVPIFFAISGFIILFVHWGDRDRPERGWDFWVKRLSRLVPTYWLVTTAVVVAGSVLSGAMRPEKLALRNLWRSYLFWPVYDLLPVLPQGWTLPHDMRFYLAFSLVILLPARRWAPWLALLMAGTVVNLGGWLGLWSFGFRTGHTYLLDFLFSGFNLPFLWGALACAAVMYRPLPQRPRRVAAVAAVIFAIAIGFDLTIGYPSYALEMLVYGLCAGGIVYGLAVRDLADASAHTPASLLRLGDASYGLYLLHVPIIVLGTRLFLRAIPDPNHAEIAALVAVESGVSVVASLVWYRRVEQPLFKRLTSRFLRPAIDGPPEQAAGAG